MAVPERAVFLKQSGESFTAEPESTYTPEAVAAVVDNIAEAYNNREKLGIGGITIVPGGGNLGRGRGLGGIGLNNPDALGRIFTMPNAALLADRLEALGIAVERMLAPTMGYFDRKGVIKDDESLASLDFASYNRDKAREAHQAGKIVIIAGGAGENKATTDYAVAFYAHDYRETSYEGEIVVLKSTEFDGIYDSDPRPAHKNGDPEPRRYRVLCAQDIQADHERLNAVDLPSLQELIDGNLEMLVYAEDQHPLVEVLSHNPATDTKAAIGTLIVPKVCTPEFY